MFYFKLNYLKIKFIFVEFSILLKTFQVSSFYAKTLTKWNFFNLI